MGGYPPNEKAKLLVGLAFCSGGGTGTFRLAHSNPAEALIPATIKEWLEATASDLAHRLRAQFSGKLISNIELAARAFNIYFGRKLPDLMSELHSYISDEEIGENDDF